MTLNANPYASWQRAIERDENLPRKGTLGMWIDGAFTIEVDYDLTLYYVRYDDGSWREVPHKNRVGLPLTLDTVESQNIPVNLGYDIEGDYSILNIDGRQANAIYQRFPSTQLPPLTIQFFVRVTDETTVVDPATLLHLDPDYFDVQDLGGGEALITFLNPLTTAGDLLFFNTALARLGIGATGQVLTVVGGLPAWVTPAGGGTSTLYVLTDTATLDNSTGDTNVISASTSTGSLTIPADSLEEGDVLRVYIRGLRSTPGAGDDSFTVVLTAEGVDLHEAFGFAPGAGIADAPFTLDLLLTLRTAGASADFYSTGEFWMDGVSVPCTPGVYSIDTTIDNDLALAVTMATADPDNVISITTVIIEKLRAS